MYQPESTYRIQFNKDFTFTHLEKIIPYLHRLGIKTIYASPIFSAIPGSTHGYDGIDPNEINPEIGTQEQLYRVARELKQRGMGWLQDFVPNHMAFSPQNKWLCDFLEKGKMSLYDTYFDKNPDEPLMVPFLGSSLDEVIGNHEINIVFSRGKLQLRYYNIEYPLNYTAYYDILSHEIVDELELAALREKVDFLSQITDKTEFQHQWEQMLNDINKQFREEPIQISFQQKLDELSEDAILLKRITEQQFYRLCYWKETNTKINYRRFFTINGLICMNMQHPDVFSHYHQLLHQLVKDNVIQGIRIDHVDGLYDPDGYLDQLRNLVGDEMYIVVEKILGEEEQLPQHWPVQGSSGYDFLAKVNNVLIRKNGENIFTEMYHKLAPDELPLSQQVYNCKRKILDDYMQGELSNLLTEFKTLPGLEFPAYMEEKDLRAVIAEALTCMPVYRFYPKRIPFNNADREAFIVLINDIKKQNGTNKDTLKFFAECFLEAPLQLNKDYSERLLHIWRRCMQLSGPLMAKGIEDTLMYRFNKLIALNEVGNTPSVFGIDQEHFHKVMQCRQMLFPLSINATATHDTKRGEDTRARLQLLSYDSQHWFKLVENCLTATKEDRFKLLNLKDKYFAIQVVYGALPLGNTGYKELAFRLKEYLAKASREAKEHSSWDKPDEAYEKALFDYAISIADPKSKAGKAIHKYLEQQQNAVITNSLVQLTLKCTCPGIPDIYQGTELLDLSFVDPDNRRAVDYDQRTALLETISSPQFDPALLTESYAEPLTKLYTLHCLLQLRKTYPDVFSKGTYEPVSISEKCLSFIRRYQDNWIWIIVPLGGQKIPETKHFIKALPQEGPASWKNIFTNETIALKDIDVVKQQKSFPVLVFHGQTKKDNRSAGILMPLFSLPSSFGIGGMGKEAYNFIRFLAKSGQNIWQILPLNPVLQENFFSPYASGSAFAGEPLYIDPLKLVTEGLLEKEDLAAITIQNTSTVDYIRAQQLKYSLFLKAWKNYRNGSFEKLERDYQAFCKQQEYWLPDYALFIILKKRMNGEPWFQWPEAFRDKETKALEEIKVAEREAIEYEQWLQFLFHKQWNDLRNYARQMNVRLVGDVPFYMSNDSADVWANRTLFNIEPDGKIKAMAGVPPDYFSETGQLWGMPTYNWKALRQSKYDWWIKRLEKNLELYDLVRLDHFRAFYDYWEVPANERTAINGKWIEGPQDAFFKLMLEHFPDMPFIAEDLGDLHQAVFDFKDKYRLPGMKVLQFGFSDYDGSLRDLPHNFDFNTIVYTGTHDNNTTRGWYRSLNNNDKKALNDYLGYKITEANASESLCRMAYSSIAKTAIMPIQDIINMDESSRINTPSTTENNWKWRLIPGDITLETEKKLLEWVKRYNR